MESPNDAVRFAHRGPSPDCFPNAAPCQLAGPEKSTLNDADVSFHQAEYERLRGELQAAHDASQLPEVPPEGTKAALNDLLVRLRLKASEARSSTRTTR